MRILRHLLAGFGLFTVAAASTFAFTAWSSDVALDATNGVRSRS